MNNLLSENSYRKYVRFFSGLAMIIIIMNPVFNLLYGSENIFSGIKINALKIDKEELEEELTMYGRSAEEEIGKEYEEVIGESLDAFAVKNNLTVITKSINIDMDYESETFGEIKGIYLKASENNESDIQNIHIDTEGNVYDTATGVKSDRLEEELADYYGIDKNKVEVYVSP